MFSRYFNALFHSYFISDKKIQQLKQFITRTIAITSGLTAIFISVGIGYSLANY